MRDPSLFKIRKQRLDNTFEARLDNIGIQKVLTTSIGAEETKANNSSFIQVDNEDTSPISEQRRSATADPMERSFKFSDGKNKNKKYFLKVFKIKEFKRTIFRKAFFVNSSIYGKLIFTFDQQ